MVMRIRQGRNEEVLLDAVAHAVLFSDNYVD